MKKTGTYIIVGLLMIGIAALILTGGKSGSHRLDKTVTFRKSDKRPYGCYVAYTALQSFFPHASVLSEKEPAGYWDSLSFYEENQALIIVSPNLRADELEMKKIIEFVENGNTVVISSSRLSSEVTRQMNFTCNGEVFETDTLGVTLDPPVFSPRKEYDYPGARYDATFSMYDPLAAQILGHDRSGTANLMHLKAGKGDLYFQLAPFAFTNYFLLHGHNLNYFENLLSLIPAKTRRIVWDEYYLNKKLDDDQDRPGFLGVLFQYPALKWGLLTAIFALAIFALLGIRRQQRPIPVEKKPQNDSLDFVKTIGRLYHDKGDHLNLAQKMATYFKEYVRTRFKLVTTSLDEEFVNQLRYKSGVEESIVRGIVSFTIYLETAPSITTEQLFDFHKQLELFYKKV